MHCMMQYYKRLPHWPCFISYISLSAAFSHKTEWAWLAAYREKEHNGPFIRAHQSAGPTISIMQHERVAKDDGNIKGLPCDR